MKNLVIMAIALALAGLACNGFAQSEALTNVFVTGPSCCPDEGSIIGTRADGGHADSGYWGQTNGGGGPTYYNIAWYEANFNLPSSTTVVVETVVGSADIHGTGVEVPIMCRGEETKILEYGMPLVFHIALGILEFGEPGDPPDED